MDLGLFLLRLQFFFGFEPTISESSNPKESHTYLCPPYVWRVVFSIEIHSHLKAIGFRGGEKMASRNHLSKTCLRCRCG